MSLFDSVIKHLPWRLQRAVHLARERKMDRVRAEQSPAEVFTRVYADAKWGGGGDNAFYSGWGSHDAQVVGTYVTAVNGFLHSLATKPDVVDLGCGDFNVGRQLRPACARYVGCDVVPSLVQHNAARFADLDVNFQCVDITADTLPAGDVVFIRQVLQHLSNAHIQQVVAKLSAYRYVVVTEHLPGTPDFPPNLEKGAGDDVRAARVTPSGVVLTAPPFNFKASSATVLCAVPARGGVIQTMLYAR